MLLHLGRIPATTATIEITGVQLEVGDTATPFEHRSYGDELRRCLRYYEKFGNNDIHGVVTYLVISPSYAASPIHSSVEMRAVPSVSGTIETRYSTTVNNDWNDMASSGSITVRANNNNRVIAVQTYTEDYTWTRGGWFRTSTDYAYDAEL